VAKDDLRVRRIKKYVIARLREDLANSPRGAQARLAKRLGVSGAHLSNMLSATPSRQPGEEFRRKVASHWGVSYAQLESIALGEDAPASSAKPVAGRTDDLRVVVREQARQHYAYSREDLPREHWQRIMTGLEREALALVALRQIPQKRYGR